MVIILQSKMQQVFCIWYLKYQILFPQKVLGKVFKCPQIKMYLVFYFNTSFWVLDPTLAEKSEFDHFLQDTLCLNFITPFLFRIVFSGLKSFHVARISPAVVLGFETENYRDWPVVMYENIGSRSFILSQYTRLTVRHRNPVANCDLQLQLQLSCNKCPLLLFFSSWTLYKREEP